MAYTSTFVPGDVLTAAQLNGNFNGAFVSPVDPTAAWTAFTPTLSGGWALGNSTYVAKYMKVGRKVTFHAVITVGSTATIGTGITAALPVTAASADQLRTLSVAFVDTGSGSYTGSASFQPTTTTVDLWAVLATGTYAAATAVTSTGPFTWTTGDLICYGGTYEAAS